MSDTPGIPQAQGELEGLDDRAFTTELFRAAQLRFSHPDSWAPFIDPAVVLRSIRAVAEAIGTTKAELTARRSRPDAKAYGTAAERADFMNRARRFMTQADVVLKVLKDSTGVAWPKNVSTAQRCDTLQRQIERLNAERDQWRQVALALGERILSHAEATQAEDLEPEAHDLDLWRSLTDERLPYQLPLEPSEPVVTSDQARAS